MRRLISLHERRQRHETDTRNPGPRRGTRPGGPSDDSPARERWVPSPMNIQSRQGRQNPFPHTNTSIRSRHQSTTTPRNTKRICREAANVGSQRLLRHLFAPKSGSGPQDSANHARRSPIPDQLAQPLGGEDTESGKTIHNRASTRR